MDAPTDKPPYAIAEPVAPFVRRVLCLNPSAFTYTGTQSYLVGSERELAVIDPGPDDADHIAALVAGIGDAKVVAICCTHTHQDHSPAAAALSAITGAPIQGCSPFNIFDDGPRSDASFDPSYQPEGVMGDGDSVGGDGWTLEAVHTPGHTSNHLCYALNGSQALFTGDHVMGWSTTVVSPPDGDMTAYMESLAKLYEREDAVYFPAHGPQVDKTRQFIRGMIGHRRQRENQIVKHMQNGISRIPDMVPLMYKGVDQRLWPAAERSVLAHLIDLEKKGKAARSGDEWATA
jgi:glyoxylase-like metal-dependent hydrolase (beta-lactamase superfamily II)